MLELGYNFGSPKLSTRVIYPNLLKDDDYTGPISIIGKLKLICSNLYSSLTSLEKDLLDKSTLPSLVSAPPTRGDCNSSNPHSLHQNTTSPTHYSTIVHLSPPISLSITTPLITSEPSIDHNFLTSIPTTQLSSSNLDSTQIPISQTPVHTTSPICPVEESDHSYAPHPRRVSYNTFDSSSLH